MKWFSDPDTLKCQGAIEFLRLLAPYLPGPVDGLVQSLETRAQISQAANNLGQTLQTYLNDILRQRDNASQRLSWYVDQNTWLEQDNRRLRADPLRQELAKTRADLKNQTHAARKAQEEVQELRRALETEQQAHQREVDELKTRVANQNQVIARQQLQLNDLLEINRSRRAPGASPASDAAGR